MKQKSANKFRYTKEERSWIMQDWANSAYSIMITTAVFPLFFKAVASSGGLSDATSTAYWGYANAIGTLIVSVLAPILGALADYKNQRMPMFTFFTLSGIIATLAFSFAPEGSWLYLFIFYVISAIGFSGANIFYDGSIIDVTTNDRMDRVSSAGFGWGYIGSSIPFVIFIIFQLTGILPISQTLLVKLGFVMTAIWWFVFTIPYWRHVEQKSYIPRETQLIKNSFKRLWGTLKGIKAYKQAFLFLIAYFFYIDGVGTIFKMATAIGSDIGLSSNDLIVVMLVVQFVAFPFSILYGVLAKRFGAKNMIFVGIVTYTFICIYALQLDSLTAFIILGLLVGTAQGGVQSLSRSLFGQLIPKERANEFFGFYNIFGKFAAVVGPFLVGIIAQLTGNSLDGVFALIILFIIGGILLMFVKIPQENSI
ncbi:MFS transporter [Jeotgalibaca sp. PTS2502]|jgi:MFS transporter, UMF1 family|uniref:MFS transporter n=1 Tax=Jeotgalibaca arthritidis TaxID=1868794 RepID=A0A6G7KC29_9LACT|nr:MULTISPECIES: MFS transporter [Jeotgalibaca]APZ48847.1 MFS transporter [Jeotgalibaca sp. PTS2502]QII82834.1 MFS transporter [Jeotgalibaca arthritidis]